MEAIPAEELIMAANTIRTLQEKKERGEKITMLTAFDYLSATIIDDAGIDAILVGDSLGMTVLGYKSTLPVTMEEMLHHTAAVSRATENALVIADMPFLSYQVSPDLALENAGCFLKEAGAKAVKLEGGKIWHNLVVRMVQTGIPVLGHIGLTPQSVNQLGGYRVQGQLPEAIRKLRDDALSLQDAGCFGLVLECIPDQVAAKLTETLKIPTIGIGAGPSCSGQVLVSPDIWGLHNQKRPKFVKQYASLGLAAKQAAKEFAEEVKQGDFPNSETSYELSPELLTELDEIWNS